MSTDYSTYLRIHDLLELQHQLTDTAHDEMLFIVVHQVYELWFKLILHELDATSEHLRAARPQEAVQPLRRTNRIWRLLIDQLQVLETMSPEGFLLFRDPLTPASGLQSGQFRAIETLSGLREQGRVDDPVLAPHDRDELRRRVAQPSLYEALCICMRAMGMQMPSGDDDGAREARLRSLAALYHDHSAPECAALHLVCELLLDHDEAIAVWRFNHALMAAREIGARTGTGGHGVPYLRASVDRRFFPELWEVRSLL